MPSPRFAPALLIALLSAAAFAQNNTAEQAAKEQKGLAALREAISQSQNLNLPINKLFLETTAAQLLWTRDEPLARSLVGNTRTRYRELASQAGTDRNRDLLLQQAYTYRRELAVTIARTDPQFALDFIHATAPPPQMSFAGNWEADLELSVAAAAAQSDPKLAAGIVRQNMAGSNAYGLASTLEQIWNKDNAAAMPLIAELMTKLTSANFSGDQQALMTATQVLQFYGSRARMVQAAARNPKAPQPPPAILSDAQIQALAQAVYSAAQKPEFPANWLQMVQNVMPQIQKFVPSATPLRNAQQGPPAEFWSDLSAAVQKGNIEQAIAMAAAAPADYRANAFQSVASNVASNTGNLDAAREVLSHSGLSEGQREQMLEQLTREAASGMANRGSLEQARATADLIRYNTERAQAYVQIAHAALSRKNKAAAAALLNDARSMVSSPPTDFGEVNVLTGIANAYLQIDPARSAEILAGLVDLVNEKMPAFAAADGFIYGGGMRGFIAGEMVMQGGGYSGLLSQLMMSLSALAGFDPDRALDLAAKLQRPEAKVVAYLSIARTLLGAGGRGGVGYGWGGGIGYVRDGGGSFVVVGGR